MLGDRWASRAHPLPPSRLSSSLLLCSLMIVLYMPPTIPFFVFPRPLWPPMDSKTWCRHTVLALLLYWCRVSVLQGCNTVNKSSYPARNCHECLQQEWIKFSEKQHFQEHTYTLSPSLSLGYQASQQISYQPSSRATAGVRGQIKKVSWHRTRLPSEVFPPNGIKSLLTAASYRHTEPLPSLVSSHNWRVNYQTDARPCLDAVMRFSFIWIMKEWSTIMVYFFLAFTVSCLVELLCSS